jgi:hypothetical protein
MKYLTLFLSNLAAALDIPTGGRFFYMNMIAGPNGNAQQWTDILIGTEKVQVPVYMTTSEY